MVENPPASVGDMGSSPGPGSSHTPQLLSTHAIESMLHGTESPARSEQDSVQPEILFFKRCLKNKVKYVLECPHIKGRLFKPKNPDICPLAHYQSILLISPKG